jgi:hypothetical protein
MKRATACKEFIDSRADRELAFQGAMVRQRPWKACVGVKNNPRWCSRAVKQIFTCDPLSSVSQHRLTIGEKDMEAECGVAALRPSLSLHTGVMLRLQHDSMPCYCMSTDDAPTCYKGEAED